MSNPAKFGPDRWCHRCNSIQPRSGFIPSRNWCEKCRAKYQPRVPKQLNRRDVPKHCPACERTLTLADFAPKKNHCRECVEFAAVTTRKTEDSNSAGPPARATVAQCPECGRILFAPVGHRATCNCAVIQPVEVAWSKRA